MDCIELFMPAQQKRADFTEKIYDDENVKKSQEEIYKMKLGIVISVPILCIFPYLHKSL